MVRSSDVVVGVTKKIPQLPELAARTTGRQAGRSVLPRGMEIQLPWPIIKSLQLPGPRDRSFY